MGKVIAMGLGILGSVFLQSVFSKRKDPGLCLSLGFCFNLRYFSAGDR